jgi:carbonic anhydrase/acetyltransferase-like protein (isoleucine patch superfamily)
MANQLRQQIEQISREKNINPDVIIAAIEDAILTASKKYYKSAEDLRSRFNNDTGQIEVFAVRQIVESVETPETQIGLDEARGLGVRLRGYVWMRRISIPHNWPDITLEAGVSLDDGVVLLCSGPAKREKIHIKSATYLNRNSILDAHEHLEIGSHCMIGPGCFLTDADHTTAPGRTVSEQPMRSEPTVLEDNVWLGAGVIVLKGVRIGRGAVVGAGAVVTHDVAAGIVVAGVPARMLTKFDDDDAQFK